MSIRHTYLFDQGDAKYREDGLIHTSSVAGVVDAVGTPYNSIYPARSYGDLSSGEMAARTVELIFSQHPTFSVGQLLPVVNDAMLSFQKDLRRTPELLAGVCLAAVEYRPEDTLEVFQIGDAFAVIEHTDGNITVSPYRSRVHEAEVRELRNRVFIDIAHRAYGCRPDDVPQGNQNEFRQMFWEEIIDGWIDLRRLNFNNLHSRGGCGLLNGQESYRHFVWHQVFPLRSIRRILLCTDGMISPDVLEGGSDLEIGRWLSEGFRRGGWPFILQEVRSIEEKRAAGHYTGASEATGYSLSYIN